MFSLHKSEIRSKITQQSQNWLNAWKSNFFPLVSCFKSRSKHGHSSGTRSEKDNLKACLVSLHLLWLLQIASQLQAHPPASSPPDPPTAVICSAKWKCDIYGWNSAQVKRNGVRMSPNDKKMTVKWGRAIKGKRHRDWWRSFHLEGSSSILTAFR